MGIKSELGQKIRRMRLKRNLTQEELAEKVDINQRTLSGIELGENFVTAETLDKLARLLVQLLRNFLQPTIIKKRQFWFGRLLKLSASCLMTDENWKYFITLVKVYWKNNKVLLHFFFYIVIFIILVLCL